MSKLPPSSDESCCARPKASRACGSRGRRVGKASVPTVLLRKLLCTTRSTPRVFAPRDIFPVTAERVGTLRFAHPTSTSGGFENGRHQAKESLRDGRQVRS